MTTKIFIGSLDQIPKGEARNFIVRDREIAVYHTHAGEVYATQPGCPHKQGPLADGLIGGATILCPLHDRLFDLRTGQNLSGDCTDIQIYPVSLTEDGRIAMEVEAAT
ncbi:Rieske (2Fe-2S) domain protein [Methylocella silvestris BL2]|uniref:Rieske (2Fe-2S) domain protein n=1 Tax=Methylocella silvestris (strain DSM 15510 / CIP 108128 / LMG 27833 / NCIMB 13906 / BL2) TaxID=395965 RepID=B8EJG5_METSB|nr:nitrite reductase small subunit NirD [Methylocella silvestris]ACK52657.1 Rieske (2Fe-2S) domain protein [Methylocella silvestris BL2]